MPSEAIERIENFLVTIRVPVDDESERPEYTEADIRRAIHQLVYAVNSEDEVEVMKALTRKTRSSMAVLGTPAGEQLRLPVPDVHVERER